MSKYEERFMIGLALITLFAVVGLGVAIYTKTHDGAVEEVAEELIEDQIEEALGLPEDTLEGKIDLTPTSKEDKKAGS
jgi:hypothetical protein